MNYVNLGKTVVQVSQLCFGTMSFGAEADEHMSGRMFHRCREAGINFFDCADAYGKGTAETILGRLLSGCRDDIVLTTKVFEALSNDVNDRGLSRRHIVAAVEAKGYTVTRLSEADAGTLKKKEPKKEPAKVGASESF